MAVESVVNTYQVYFSMVQDHLVKVKLRTVVIVSETSLINVTPREVDYLFMLLIYLQAKTHPK